MISITRLLCDAAGPGDHLRYEKKDVTRPVVVWNCTRQCNLHCMHCYATATTSKAAGEMSTAQGKAFIDDLVKFGVPVILFSGGEPLMREDLFELANYAKQQGLRVALSTNGTVINQETANKLAQVGFAEIGISLDGIGEKNDRFRGKDGAFDAALDGIRHCVALKLRVSLRLTMTGYNYREIPAILQLTEDEKIDRVCLYHLAYSGRGGKLREQDITHPQTRWAIDTICERTLDMYRRGLRKEILTVGNHADGIYLYIKAKEKDPARAAKIMELINVNGGNNSGIKISCVDDRGNVHPDQFWWHYSLGNVLQRNFSEIWMDTAEPLLVSLRDRKKKLKGRCARCSFINQCNGNLRVRAEAAYGDVWAEDPACYLTEEEIQCR
ncbi:MAG: radical SAM protein [Dehalococcoidales bacterium]|nr:radical SAM protein [Dehalococcoidales bacterium]